MRYFLGLGSNLGNRQTNLNRARSYLQKEGIRIIKSSSVYESQPVDYTDQPWFLNQALEVESSSHPFAVLELVKNIEAKMGRKTTSPKGPRIIDIDILLAEDTVCRSQELEIPHPRMQERMFVLVPLKEIAPDVVHPVFKKQIEDLWRKNKDSSTVRIFQ